MRGSTRFILDPFTDRLFVYAACGVMDRVMASKSRTIIGAEINRRPSPAYLALVNSFPLRPLRNERVSDAATAIVDVLAIRPEGLLDAGEQDYLDTLTMLVATYDREQDDLETP